MSYRKISDFESQLDSIRMFLPAYLHEHGLNVENGKKICCLNPEHNDHNPSMSMFMAEQGYPLVKCMSCGSTMDIFNAAHVLENKPMSGPGFVDNTVAYLADKYGIELVYRKLSEDEVYELNMYQAYEAASNYIVSRHDFNENQLGEMEKRGFDTDFMKKYRIGVCNDVADMRRYLNNLGFKNTFIDEIDLCNPMLFNPSNFIYTICDEFGRPVGFQARNLNYDGVVNEDGKFVNGPKFIGTKNGVKKNIYKKNERLYLLDKARKTTDSIFVVEGNSDALSLHNHGMTNAVGICGLDFSEAHLNTLRRNGLYNITICLDNDAAGRQKAIDMLDKVVAKTHDIKFSFVFLPDEYVDGHRVKIDPDEFVRKYGIEKFKEIPRVSSFSWRLSLFEDDDMDPADICEKMVPIITSEPSSIRREKMISELSVFTGYSDRVIRDEVNKSEREKDRRSQDSKRLIVEKLIKDLSSDSGNDSEILLSEALSNIGQINQMNNTDIMDTSARVNNILGIKEYQEDPSSGKYTDWGGDMPILSATTDGDIQEKVVFIGGSSNSGKTSWQVNLSWRIVENNPHAMVIFLSIDDSAKELLPRFICYDAAKRARDNGNMDVFDALNINKFAKPELYKDSREYPMILEEREIFFRKFLSYAREDRFIIYDSVDGRSLAFIKTLMANYRDKYPGRHIYFFIDNFHLIQVPTERSGREKFQHISHELKAYSVEFGLTVVSTVEYTKMPPETRPHNNNIAESNSLVYDSNLIMHGWNELHGLRENAVAYHIDYSEDETHRRKPLVIWSIGKNKVASFKGDIPTRFWPEKAYFEEMTQREFDALIQQNTAAKQNAAQNVQQ